MNIYNYIGVLKSKVTNTLMPRKPFWLQRTHVRARTHTHTHANTQTHTNTRTHTRTHTHICTHTHTHTHTHMGTDQMAHIRPPHSHHWHLSVCLMMAPRLVCQHSRNWCQVPVAKMWQLPSYQHLLQIADYAGAFCCVQKDGNHRLQYQDCTEVIHSHLATAP